MRPYAPNSALVAFYDYTPAYTERPDVPFYVEEAQGAGGDVLELGCGTGRVLIPTARALAADSALPDRRVVGIDLSDGMLARCKVKLAAEPDSVRGRVRLLRANMAAFELEERFALVTAPFRGLQHLLTVEDQLACLARVRRHLLPGGRFVFDVFHPDPRFLHDGSVAAEREDVPERALPDGRRYRRATRVVAFHRARQVNDVEIISYVTDAGGRTERVVDAFPMRYYFPFELEHLVARAGLDLVAMYGDFARTPLGDASPELVVLARAPQGARGVRTARGGAARSRRPTAEPGARGAPPEQHDTADAAEAPHPSIAPPTESSPAAPSAAPSVEPAAKPSSEPSAKSPAVRGAERAWTSEGRRVIAIDWSGANEARERRKGIWVAEAQTGRLLHLESGRDRAGVVELLAREAERDPQLVVGFDFAFSLPAWYLEQNGHRSAYELWERVEREGTQWLATCEWPFWGKPGQARPNLPKHFRRTETRVHEITGLMPKSVFQISGAGAVGAGAIRGMPLLRRLRDAGFSVWPFDAPGGPSVVEIYPRVLTGRVTKSSAEQRTAYLRERYARDQGSLDAKTAELLVVAATSDDAFDAAVSALVMDAHQAALAALTPESAPSMPEAALEGEIWMS